MPSLRHRDAIPSNVVHRNQSLPDERRLSPATPSRRRDLNRPTHGQQTDRRGLPVAPAMRGDRCATRRPLTAGVGRCSECSVLRNGRDGIAGCSLRAGGFGIASRRCKAYTTEHGMASPKVPRKVHGFTRASVECVFRGLGIGMASRARGFGELTSRFFLRWLLTLTRNTTFLRSGHQSPSHTACTIER